MDVTRIRRTSVSAYLISLTLSVARAILCADRCNPDSRLSRQETRQMLELCRKIIVDKQNIHFEFRIR